MDSVEALVRQHALNAASSEGFRKSCVGLDLPLVCVSYMVEGFECSLAL